MVIKRLSLLLAVTAVSLPLVACSSSGERSLVGRGIDALDSLNPRSRPRAEVPDTDSAPDSGVGAEPVVAANSGPARAPRIDTDTPQASSASADDVNTAAPVAVAPAASTSPYMDRQEAELRRQFEPRGVKVLRAGNQIVLMAPSTMAFNPNSDALRSRSTPLFASIAGTLKKYDKTRVDVYGHTSAGGDEKRNLDLTQRRALAVARVLAKSGINAKRLSVTGFGSSRPLDQSVASETGLKDQRIEIQISPTTAG